MGITLAASPDQLKLAGVFAFWDGRMDLHLHWGCIAEHQGDRALRRRVAVRAWLVWRAWFGWRKAIFGASRTVLPDVKSSPRAKLILALP